MHTDDLIPAGEYCTYYNVEISFIRDLHESGLIVMTERNGRVFLPADELSKLEKFARMHYELAINTEGIEAISHLLSRVDGMQEEIRGLRNRLQRYESRDTQDFSEAEI